MSVERQIAELSARIGSLASMIPTVREVEQVSQRVAAIERRLEAVESSVSESMRSGAAMAQRMEVSRERARWIAELVRGAVIAAVSVALATAARFLWG